MRRLHVLGRKNHGKTTLVAELVAELTRRGWRIGTIKHTHHHHELDTPGKDSWMHRQAGAREVLVPYWNDPLVVRRLKRLRLRARKARLDGIASTGAGEGAHA